MSFLMSFRDKIMDEDFMDDGIDNIHRQYMPVFLLIIDVFLGIKQFVGDPIECFVPKELSGQQEKYVNAYCWTSSTYQLIDRDYSAFRGYADTDVLIVRPEDRARNAMANQDNFANTHLSGEKLFISYYQWVPITIAMSAVLFYLPHVFWCSLTQNSGLYFKHILYGAKGLAKIQSNPVSRKTMLEDLTLQFNKYLLITRKQSKKDSPGFLGGRGCGTKFGNYLAFLYIGMKVMFLANVFIQLYAMHAFLGTNILSHCFNLIESTIFSHQFIASKRFPIRTLCEFYGSPQVHGYLLSYTCHCVLPINLYNDKIFAFVAFLFLALGIITILSLMVWIYRLFYPPHMEKFIRHYLEVNNKLKSPEHSRLFRPFVEEHLRLDGCFMFKMMDRNLGNVVTDSIIIRVWDTYIEKCKEEGLLVSSGSSTPKSKVLDLEGSPSRPGSRQPLIARPLANGVPPSAPMYPVLKSSDIPTGKKTPPKTSNDVAIVIPNERQPLKETPFSFPVVAEVLSAVEITVDPPQYNDAPPFKESEVEPPPAYNSYFTPIIQKEESSPVQSAPLLDEEIKSMEDVEDVEGKVEPEIEKNETLVLSEEETTNPENELGITEPEISYTPNIVIDEDSKPESRGEPESTAEIPVPENDSEKTEPGKPETPNIFDNKDFKSQLENESESIVEVPLLENESKITEPGTIDTPYIVDDENLKPETRDEPESIAEVPVSENDSKITEPGTSEAINIDNDEDFKSELENESESIAEVPSLEKESEITEPATPDNPDIVDDQDSKPELEKKPEIVAEIPLVENELEITEPETIDAPEIVDDEISKPDSKDEPESIARVPLPENESEIKESATIDTPDIVDDENSNPESRGEPESIAEVPLPENEPEIKEPATIDTPDIVDDENSKPGSKDEPESIAEVPVPENQSEIKEPEKPETSFIVHDEDTKPETRDEPESNEENLVPDNESEITEPGTPDTPNFVNESESNTEVPEQKNDSDITEPGTTDTPNIVDDEEVRVPDSESETKKPVAPDTLDIVHDEDFKPDTKYEPESNEEVPLPDNKSEIKDPETTDTPNIVHDEDPHPESRDEPESIAEVPVSENLSEISEQETPDTPMIVDVDFKPEANKRNEETPKTPKTDNESEIKEAETTNTPDIVDEKIFKPESEDKPEAPENKSEIAEPEVPETSPDSQQLPHSAETLKDKPTEPELIDISPKLGAALANSELGDTQIEPDDEIPVHSAETVDPTKNRSPYDSLINSEDIMPELIYPETDADPDISQPLISEPAQLFLPHPVELLPPIPESEEPTDQPQGDSMSDSLVESVDLTLDENIGKNNHLKPTETPPPPYSTLPRSYDTEHHSTESSPSTSVTPIDDFDDAVLLAENAVLAESPLPVEASAPVVPSPHNTPPPASPTSGIPLPSDKPPIPPSGKTSKS